MISDKLSKISYILTTECNLGCEFCYENGTKRDKLQLSENHIYKFTEFVIDNYGINNSGLQIEIIGGEPLLFKEWSYISNAIDLLLNNNVNISKIIIFTNNTVRNDSFIKFLEYIKMKKLIIEFDTVENLSNNCKNRLKTKFIENEFETNNQSIKNLGIKVNKNRIIDKKSLYSFKEFLFDVYKNNSRGTISEFTNKHDIDCNDFYNIAKTALLFLKENNIKIKSDVAAKIIKKSGLLYLYIIIYEDCKYTKRRERYCMPFMEEISITPKGNIIPCSRALQFENDFTNINSKTLVDDISLYKCNMVNGRAININELGENCDECALNSVCTPCKILPNNSVVKNNVFYFPKEKCDYEYNAFYGQLKAYKEMINTFGDD